MSGPMTAEKDNKKPNSGRAHTAESNNQSSTSSSSGTSGESGNHGAGSDSKTFEFVLVTDAESRRQVRRHAMRQYMRQRRQDSIARLEPSRVSSSNWSQGVSPAESSRSSKLQEIKDEKEESKREPRPSGNSLVTTAGNHSGSFPTFAALEKFSFSNPMSNPSSPAIYDPFNSYPIAMSPEDHNLIQHFVVTYPLMMYKMGGTKQSNPMEKIFRQFALHDPLPFEAMLSIAAKHLAGVEGRKDSVQSLTHKMRALRMINERLQSDTGVERDSTIYAAATLAVIEKWSKDAQIERMHVKGLSYLIRRRGGMRGMRASSHFLGSVLYWVDFSCAAKAITSANLPWTGDTPDSPPTNLEFIVPDLQFAIPQPIPATEECEDALGILHSCEDFLTFFRYLYGLQQSLLQAPPPPPTPSADTTGVQYRRRPLFDPSTRLYSILTTLPDYDHGIRDVRFIDEYTCLACLIYMNLALYESYKTSANFDHYLEWLGEEITAINPYANPSIASVLWLFMDSGGFANFETQDSGERSWVVARMLRVAKRLEWKLGGTLWERLRGVLLGFLTTQQECGLGRLHVGPSELYARSQRLSQQDDFLWDEDEMRREILGDLYAGPPLYAPEISEPGLSSLYTPVLKLEDPMIPQMG